MKNEIENYYWKRAEEYIDALYNKGYFDRDVTRDDMRKVEEYLAFLFQSQVNSAVKASEMLRQIRKTDTKGGENNE